MLLFLCMKWLVSVALLSLPSFTFAQGFIQCGYERMCNACDVITTTNTIINWLFGILAMLAVISLVVAGFRLVVSGGNVSAWKQAKQMFTNVIIGFVIVLSAWLIVDTIMKGMLDPEFKAGFGMWNSLDGVNCDTGNSIDIPR